MSRHIYFHEGDKVQIKHDLNNKPEMLVKKVQKARVGRDEEEESKSVLLGVTCFWFTDTLLYQQQTFNSKDLEKLD
jgi:hypothetical protein